VSFEDKTPCATTAFSVQQQQQRGVGVVYFFSTMMTSSTDIVSIMQEGEKAKMAENDAAAEEQQLSAVAPPSFNPNPSRPVSGPYVSVPSSDYPSRNFNGQKSESSVEVPLVVFGHTGDEEGEEDGPFSAKKKTAPGSSGSSSSSGYRQRSGWSSCSIGSASVILLIVLSLVVGIPIAIIARRASTEAQEHDASWVDPNATQHRTAFHFQPEQNWMNGQSLLPSLALSCSLCVSVSVSVSLSLWVCLCLCLSISMYLPRVCASEEAWEEF
jgi:hypothetical protein